MMKRVLRVLPIVAMVTACSSSTSPSFSLRDVQISFATAPTTPPLSMRRAAPEALFPLFDKTLSDGTNVLVLSSVELVLKEVELRRLEVANCDITPEPEGCEKFEAGPVLVSLPLEAGVQAEFSLGIGPGTYTEIEFEIHKIEDNDPDDATFRQQHPEFVDQSIRVTGTFNDQAFLFETDIDAEQKLNLAPPLVVDESMESANVTIFVDVDAWFRFETGDLIDPATANKGEPNESLVGNNIKDSLEAFEDDDRDGSR